MTNDKVSKQERNELTYVSKLIQGVGSRLSSKGKVCPRPEH